MKNKYIKSLLICLSLIGEFYASTAQNLNPVNTTNILPPSPDVAALGKFISMPVSYSTGVPEISVPIYTVTTGDLSLPISLSYNASGIRVEETATWVGLGWNLQAGGSISRMVRGLPDDLQTNGYMYTTKTVHYIDSLPFDSDEKFTIYENQIGQNILDVEPDIYSFSVMGYSGRFYFNQQSGQFVMTPYQNIKLDYMVNGTGGIIQWTITLPNGVKCYFGNSSDGSRPITEQSAGMNNYTMTNGSLSSNVASVGTHNTAWPIVQILSPTSRSIDFYYLPLLATDFGRSGESMEYDLLGSNCLATNFSSNKRQKVSFYKRSYTKPILTRISTDLCDVNFIESAQGRIDMAGVEKYLDTIVVKDKNNQTIKRFDFNYSYSTCSDVIPVNPTGVADTIPQKRLVLNSFTEVNDAHTFSLPYTFTYNTSVSLPSRLSASQDYWGYYNGKANGEYLSPQVTVAAARGSGSGYETGSDRTIDPIKAQAAILTKIRYPTGGSTSYTYESNRAVAGFAGPDLAGFQNSGLTSRSISMGNTTQSPQSVDGDPAHPTSHYTNTFSVNNISGQAQLTANCDGCSSNLSTLCPMYGTLTGITNPGFSMVIAENFSTFITLPNGQYNLEMDITPNATTPAPNFSCSLAWSENSDAGNLLVGGLRIKTIVSDDSIGKQLSRSYTYTNFTNPSVSSGNIYNLPTTIVKSACGGTQGLSISIIQSNSSIPLSSLDGNLIRYQNVTEYYDQNQSSYKTEYTFSMDNLFDAEPYGGNYPSGSPVQSDWRSGILTEKKEYESLGKSHYRILRDEQYFYQNFQSASSDEFGIKFAPYEAGGSGTGGTEYFGITPYSFKTEWYLPDSTYTTEYSYKSLDNQTGILATQTKNYYNSRYFIADTKTSNSKGQVIENKFWYPFDYNNITGFNMSLLVGNGILEKPVKQEITNNGNLTAGQVIQYNLAGKPIATYDYENNNLVVPATFDPNTIITSYYQPKTAISYDSYYNIQQVLPQLNYPTGYIWDYKGSYPIAMIKNANSLSYAYTSFEADGSGNWTLPDGTRDMTYSFTGSLSYDLTSGKTISASVPAGKQYIVSYWSRNSAVTVNSNGTSISAGPAGPTKSGWTYYQHTLPSTTTSVTLTSSTTVPIDELRLFPVDAQMTTYTYYRLIGISSSCDPTNKTTYYNYDALGRLQSIKDLDGNIIKTVQYHYKGQ